MQPQSSAATQVTKQGRELIIERVFNAPRELVFEAFSTCEHLMQWWGTHMYPITSCSIDFRPEGVWHYCMTGPNGEQAWGKAIYREIVKPERIVYADYFSDAQGNINEELPETLATVEFHAQDGKTRLVSRSLYATEEALDQVLAMGAVEGFSESIERLETYLASR